MANNNNCDDNNCDDNNKKLEIINNIYKQKRLNIDCKFNDYLIDKYCKFKNKSSFWALFSLLDKFTDLSESSKINDSYIKMSNTIYALQTAEAIKKSNNNYPEWMPLLGLIYTMGNILYMNCNDNDGLNKMIQWAITGNTFITGCPIPDNIILPEYNKLNNDHNDGINLYSEACGLSNVSISFGRDEYLYRLLIANNHKMPIESEYIIRYNSLYTWHNSDEYNYLESSEDKIMKKNVKEFINFKLNKYNDNLPTKWNSQLLDYYSNLVKKYISENMIIKW